MRPREIFEIQQTEKRKKNTEETQVSYSNEKKEEKK